jgi:hypothetical protein
VDEEYRKEEFQTTPEDRPLVAHFSGRFKVEYGVQKRENSRTTDSRRICSFNFS